MDNKVPNNIAKFRKAHGLSQADLAAKLKISITQLSRLERGVSSLSQSRMKDLAAELEVKPEEIFQSHEPREKLDLDVMHEVIVQLDRLLNRMGLEPTPEQRADLTIEIYRLETDGLAPDALDPSRLDLKKYEGMLRTLTKL